MTYTKNTWLDQQVERPKTYKVIDNEDETITLVDSFGTVTELGTFVNATNMNHIEDGIANNDERITQNTADILDLQNISSQCVNLTGEQTITGQKTFAAETSPNTIFQFANIDQYATPSEIRYNRLELRDSNGYRVGSLEQRHMTDGSLFLGLNTSRRNGDNTVYTKALGVGMTSSGSAYTVAPASALIDSIVTTTGISKGWGGYVKLGNGIIIQWGSAQVYTYDTTITLPTAFSSINGKVIAMDNAYRNVTGFQNVSGRIYSTTQLRLCATSETTSVSWIAIGY